MSTAISVRNSRLKERVSSLPNLLWALVLGAIIPATTSATPPSAKETISKQFWGSLYQKGGETFYCKKPFSKKTPLIAASEQGYLKTVKFLVEQGADVNKECKELVDGKIRVRTPLNMAKLKGHDEVEKYLIQKGAVK